MSDQKNLSVQRKMQLKSLLLAKAKDELQKEARERAAEARSIGATQMYRDNMRALNPMLRNHV